MPAGWSPGTRNSNEITWDGVCAEGRDACTRIRGADHPPFYVEVVPAGNGRWQRNASRTAGFTCNT